MLIKIWKLDRNGTTDKGLQRGLQWDKTESAGVKKCTENRMKTQDPLNYNVRLGGSGVDDKCYWSEAVMFSIAYLLEIITEVFSLLVSEFKWVLLNGHITVTLQARI